MRDTHQRLFIALDEWLGVFVSIFLFEINSKLFWWFVIPWAIAVYLVSYPWYWGWYGRERVAMDIEAPPVVGLAP